MHRANLSAGAPSPSIRPGSAGAREGRGGTVREQVAACGLAEGYRGLLTAICLSWLLGSTPLLLGSGKSGMPFERMQREKASAPFS